MEHSLIAIILIIMFGVNAYFAWKTEQLHKEQ